MPRGSGRIMSSSPFIVEWIERLAPRGKGARRALDVAMGRGRHAVVLAQWGFRTFGVDIKIDAQDYGSVFVVMPRGDGAPAFLRLRY